MSSIGLSNVPNKTNKEMSEKFFSEIREESIDNTTRNFYTNLMNQDSQLESQNYETERKYENLNTKKSEPNLKDGGTSSDFLEQLKEMSSSYTKKDTYGTGYTSSKYEEYTSANNYGNAYSFGNNYLQTDSSPTKNYNGNVESSSKNYSAESNGQSEPPQAGYVSSYTGYYSSYNANIESSSGQDYVPTYEYESKKEFREYTDSNLDYGYKVTEHGDSKGYDKVTENLLRNERERERKKLDDGLEMKYSVMEKEQCNEEYAVEWDPEILADLQKNVHSSWIDAIALLL